MRMAKRKRLEVIKREFGASMYYLEATCSLSCADLEFCNLVFNLISRESRSNCYL